MAKPEQLKVPYQVASLETVPAPLRLFFTERDGAFHLNLDGDHPDSVRLAEFREHNRTLHTKLKDTEERLKVFGDLDPVAAKQAMEKLATLDADALVKAREDLEQQLEVEKQAHRAAVREAKITAAFVAAGGEPKAADYVVQLAGDTFTVNKDGTLTTKALDPSGVPFTIETWLRAQQQVRPFLFRPSKGGGANTTSTGAAPKAPSVSRHDLEGFGKHLEGIAKGEVVVQD